MDAKLRKLMIRQSELREKINGLQAVETRSTEQDTDLTTARNEYAEVERELRAALADDGQPVEDAEVRERRELRSRTSVTDFVQAAINRTGVTGAAAEYAEAEGCAGMLPTSMLFPPRRETRAAATVAAAAVAENVAPTAGEVFVSPLADALGIMTPTAAAGTASYPYISAGIASEAVAAGSDVSDSSPAISAKAVEPRRLSATFDTRREEMAKLADLESALTENIGQSLRDEFDDQIVSGNNTDPNLNGVLTQKAATAPADNTVTTFQTLVDSVKDFVDGTHAEDFNQVSLVTSPRVASFLVGLLLNAGNRQDNALDWLRSTYPGGFRISRKAPTIAQTDHSTAGDRRAGGGGLWAVRRRVPVLAYAPIWNGIELIRDEVTGAKSGTITVTAYMLAGGVAMVRPAAYDVATVKTVQGVAP